MPHADTDFKLPNGLVYAGFWIRVWASVIDSVLVLALTLPLLALVGEGGWRGALLGSGSSRWDVWISWVLPAIAVLVCWQAKSATPGKLAVRARIVDAATGGAPSTAQLLLRYAGYFVSTVPLGLGLLWIGIDARKQGWHDKLARTVVVRVVARSPNAATRRRTHAERTAASRHMPP